MTEEQLAASLALSSPSSTSPPTTTTTSSSGNGSNAPTIIVRAMPNAAAAVRRSTTLLASSAFAPAPAASGIKDAITHLFTTLGTARVVPPATLEAAAVVAASGPAFFARVVGAVAEGLHGLLDETGCGGSAEENADLALQLAAGAMGGAAALVERGGWSAEEVEKRVASVGGSTAEGLRVLGERGVGEAMGEAVMVTFEAARGLGGGRGDDGGVEGNGAPANNGLLEMPADGMMKAVVLKKERQVVLEQRPIPAIEGPGEVLVKVEFSGLCGRYVDGDTYCLTFTDYISLVAVIFTCIGEQKIAVTISFWAMSSPVALYKQGRM